MFGEFLGIREACVTYVNDRAQSPSVCFYIGFADGGTFFHGERRAFACASADIHSRDLVSSEMVNQSRNHFEIHFAIRKIGRVGCGDETGERRRMSRLGRRIGCTHRGRA